MTMIRGAVVTLAAVVLGAGVFVSEARAAPLLCGSKPCTEEIAAECGVFSGAVFRACKRSVIELRKISGETFCSCTNPALPPCVHDTSPTTTSTTSTTTTTTTVPGEGNCVFAAAAGCVGTCPVTGEACVLLGSGGCGCSAAVDRKSTRLN